MSDTHVKYLQVFIPKCGVLIIFGYFTIIGEANIVQDLSEKIVVCSKTHRSRISSTYLSITIYYFSLRLFVSIG